MSSEPREPELRDEADEPNESGEFHDLLDEMGRFERAVLDDAASETELDLDASDVEAEMARARDEAFVRGTRGRSNLASRVVLSVMGMAAAVLIAGLVLGWFTGDEPDGPDDPTVLGMRPTLVEPLGTGASFERFVWTVAGELPPNTYFRLDLRDENDRPIVAPIEDLTETSWTADTAVRDFEGTLRWRVVIVRGESTIDASPWAIAAP